MLEIPKQYGFDEKNRSLAMKIPLAIYNQVEEILENSSLARLMQEVEDKELLSGDAAYSYYQSLKLENVD